MLIKALIGQIVDRKDMPDKDRYYKIRQIEKFINWVSKMQTEGKEKQLKYLLDNLGGSEGTVDNLKTQAFLLNLFVL